MAELQKINDYLAGDVNLKDIDYIVVKAGDANFFQVTGGAHFFGVDEDNNSIYNLWLDSDGKFVSEDANGHKDVVAYIDNNKLQVVYGRHTDPYNGLSQPVTVTLDGTEDKGKSLLNAFKGYADTWFNNLYVPRVKEISVEVAVTPAPVLMTSFSLDKSEITGKVGDVIKVNAHDILPGNTSKKDINVDSSDKAVATAVDNLDGSYSVTLVKEGKTTANWVAADGGGAKKDLPVTVSPATGV